MGKAVFGIGRVRQSGRMSHRGRDYLVAGKDGLNKYYLIYVRAVRNFQPFINFEKQKGAQADALALILLNQSSTKTSFPLTSVR